jgi:hypothetical protein
MARSVWYPCPLRSQSAVSLSSEATSCSWSSPVKETKSNASGSPCRIWPRAAYSIFCRERSRIVLSISSTWAGSQDSASSVALIAPWTVWKWPTAKTCLAGLGTSPTRAEVTMASVPSEPTRNLARSNGAPSASRSSR